MELKFRKVKGKDEWRAQNGTRIWKDIFAGSYCINKGTWFKWADTLEAAKELAQTDYMFNGR